MRNGDDTLTLDAPDARFFLFVNGGRGDDHIDATDFGEPVVLSGDEGDDRVVVGPFVSTDQRLQSSTSYAVKLGYYPGMNRRP